MKQPIQTLPLVASSNSFNLIIPDEVEFKIREWCRLNPMTEWSGTLFYTIEGSFEEGNIEFTVQDFFVMDIGTAGFTNYKETPEICAYMMDNDLLDCKTGLIHSHNNMKAFFSGTDASTLAEEGESTTHFLSLIVNNDGNYVARVTRKITEIIEGVKQIKYLTYNGEEICTSENVKTGERTFIQYFDLNIKVNNPFADIKMLISQRYAELKTTKVKTPQIFEDYMTKPFTPTFNSGVEISSKPVQSKEEEIRIPTEVKQSQLFPDEVTELENVAKEHVAQIIYGNMLLSLESFNKFTKVDEWITTNMEKAFNKRFGIDPQGFVVFQDWMYQFCDTIMWDLASYLVTRGDAVEVEDGAAVIASAMRSYLEEIITKAFKKESLAECDINDYLSYIIECFEHYIG